MPPAGLCRAIAVLGAAAAWCAGWPAANAQPLLPNDARLEKLTEPQSAPVEQIIKFSLVENDLGISSSMKLADGRRQVKLDGVEGNTHVEVGRRMRRSGNLLPYFELVHTGPAAPDGGGSSETKIYAQGSVVRIERKIYHGDMTTTIQLRQDGPSRTARPPEPRGDRVSLQVQTTRGEQTIEDVRVAAGSFSELLRKSPSVAARHIGPMLRQFKQDQAVFRIEPEIAWQIFPDALETTEATQSKVLELVDRLDASDREARELATAELEVMGGLAIAALAEANRASLTPEQNTRIDAVLNRYRRLSDKEVAALREDPHYLLRCFVYSDLQQIRAAAAEAATRKLADRVDVKDLQLDSRAPLARRYRLAATIRSVMPAE